MKKIFTLLFCTAMSALVWANEPRTDADGARNPFGEQPGRRGYFTPHWFLSAGVGGQIYFGDHNGKMSFGDRLTPAFELRGGYWFNRNLAARIGINGFSAKGLTQNGSHLDGDGWYDQEQGLRKQKIEYFQVGADVLYQALNLFGGYKPDRAYELLPYLGVGMVVATSEPTTSSFGASAGVYNVFRIDQTWGLTLDVRGTIVSDKFDGEPGGSKGEGILNATVGVVYNLW